MRRLLGLVLALGLGVLALLGGLSAGGQGGESSDSKVVAVARGAGVDGEVGIEHAKLVSGEVTVSGWVTGAEAPSLVVSAGRQHVRVVAAGARFDRDLVFPDQAPHWGFVATLAAPDATEVCVASSTSEVCRVVACDEAIFRAKFQNKLDDRFPTLRYSAHVVDTRTGCEYGIRPALSLTTASVVKLEMLGDLLLDAQRTGRGLTNLERTHVNAMMRYSSNESASWVYGHIGGVASLTSFSRLVGATHTIHEDIFGTTVSTAVDRNAVVLAVLANTSALAAAGVEEAWTIVSGVARSQSWGISAGVPAGWRVGLKNGFYPFGTALWRVGSSGFVADPSGGGYAITVMTDGVVEQRRGVALVEMISEHVASHLTAGAPSERPFDEVECVTATPTNTWDQLTRQLGLTPRDVSKVVRAAGGDGPFGGQMVCTP